MNQLPIKQFETPASRALAFAEHDAIQAEVRAIFKIYGGGTIVEQVSRIISAVAVTGKDQNDDAVY